MFKQIINNLIINLPSNITNKKVPQEMDLVLSGGCFNGSYLLGGLYFLKEMEKRGYIKINRISGSSVGSMLGLLYVTDELEYFQNSYNCVYNSFKECNYLKVIKELLLKIKNKLCNNLLDDKINNKLYICYNNVLTCKKIVKRKYKDYDELFDVILKSCFVPFLIDKNMFYNNKYIDGLTPYFFKTKVNTQTLFLDLITCDKLFDLIIIKNEKNNTYRILSGILETHYFYTKNKNTYMCNDLKKLSIFNKMKNNCLFIIERVVIYILYVIL